MHEIIDLRSDTVTKPTPAMRRAMAEAVVGDDVLGDDPTVMRLEARAAERMGKEAALFVPSGTMGNNIAINVLTRPGDEILLDSESHSLCYEVGAPSALSGVQTRPFRSHQGVPDLDEIEASIHEPSLHSPGTTLLVLENTHNRAGGAVIPLDIHQALYRFSKKHGMSIHLDGARIFNAEVASGVPAAEYASQADSLTFCLSKGLGCPVGSLLCGSREFISAAQRVRKRFGGGMRQSGILAACGLLALDTMVDRLEEDHRRARRLAAGIHGRGCGIVVDLDSVQTNMVYFETVRRASDFAELLAARRVQCLPTGAHTIRLVTHHDVDDEDIEAAIEAILDASRADA